MRFVKQVLLVVLLFINIGVMAVENPLPVVLEGTPLFYAGDWYGLSGRTNGVVLRSTNLMTWQKAGQAVNQKVNGVQEWLYRNGLVYLYVQDKGYAVSFEPTHAFSSIRRLEVSGEDVNFFEDPSGTLFSLFRHKGSTDRLGVQVWRSPTSKSKSFKKLIDADIGLWDAFDSAEFGNPSALYYRGKNYFLYAANHAGPRTGERVIGVAASTNIIKIANLDKQHEPVLQGSLEKMTSAFNILLPTGAHTAWRGYYVFKKPKKETWNEANYFMKGWRGGEGGFGYPFKEEGVRILSIRTAWKKDAIWIRREFTIKEECPQKPFLVIRHEGPVELFLNGKPIYKSIKSHPSYTYSEILYPPKSCFIKGKNVLAAHAVSRKNDAFHGIDFGLFDAQENITEPLVLGVDSPRIVDGPNGFEKWMFYNAWWDGKYGTGLDRVFFYGNKLVVDGPTTTKTVGFHPPPTQPTFKSNFSDTLGSTWKKYGGEWVVGNHQLTQTVLHKKVSLLLQQKPAQNYLFETHLAMDRKSAGSIGVVAYDDGKNRLLIRIHPAQKRWDYQRFPNDSRPISAPLPRTFKWDSLPIQFKGNTTPWHRLRVVKNGGYFDVKLDSFNLTTTQPIRTRFKGKGQPGLLCDSTKASFKNVVYTQGWDEYGPYVAGWGSAADGTSKSGDWAQSWLDGLQQTNDKKVARAFKGDLLDFYEFTAQVQIKNMKERMKGEFGVFPVFRDKNNYLKAVIDTKEKKLIVSGMLQGMVVGPFSKSLHRRIAVCALRDKYNNYRNTNSWVFQLPSPSIISGLNVQWLEGKTPFLNHRFSLPADDILLRYALSEPLREPLGWEDNPFIDIDDPKNEEQKSGLLNHIYFNPVIGNHIGVGFSRSSAVVVNQLTGEVVGPAEPGMILMPWEEIVITGAEGDTDSFPKKVLMDVEMESSYFFRCVKLKNKVIIELNGEPMLEVEGSWAPSQVGLFSKNQICFFDGITLIHHPKQTKTTASQTGTDQ